MTRTFRHRLTLGVATILLGACATSSIEADAQSSRTRTPQPFTQAERQQGQQAHTQIMQEFGNAYQGPQAAYVTRVGQSVAVHSGLSQSQSDFTVTLLNSPVNNAFAVPGGYIYVTRQLVALMNDESELGGVLSHEVVHTAQRHARQRQRRSTIAGLAGILGTVLGGAVGDNGGVLGGLGGLLQNNAMRAAQVYTLGFSRSQETESDDIGIRYLLAAGYDTMGLSRMLASLAAQNALEQRALGRDARTLPAWASTHPDPASRVRRAQQQAQAVGGTNGRTNRDAFIASLDNLLYGDDPRQGVVEGNVFQHPDLRLTFTVPQGYAMQNGTSAVGINGSGGQGQFSTGRYDGNLETYVRSAFQSLAGNQQNGQQAQVPQLDIRRTTVNGIPAAYATTRANVQNQAVDVTVFAYEFARDQAFHFVMLTPSGRSATLSPMYESVRRLTASEAAAIRPRRVDIVSVGRNDTVQTMAARMAYRDYQLDRFLVLNGLTSTSRLTAGQRVKIIVYGTN